MPRIYYGWWVTAATAVIYTVIMGVVYNSYGLYVLPLAEEFGLSRANANSGLIIINVGVAMISPFLGRALDIVSVKRVMILSSLVFMIASAALAFSRSLWLSVAILALVMPFGLKGTGTLTAPLLIVRWFTVRRGRAMILSQLGYSMGGLVFPPIVGLLMVAYDWRTALLATGVGAGFILLAISLVLRDRPAPGEMEQPVAVLSSDGTPRPPQAAMSLGEVLKIPVFWAIAGSCGMVAAIGTALMVSMVPFAQGQGLSMLQAASLLSITAASGIGAKLVIAVIADRFDRVLLMTALFVIGASLNGALMMSHGYVQLAVVAGGLGIVNSAILPLQFALMADRFGASSFGVVAGLTAPITAVLGVLTIRYSGEVFDRTGNYDLMFVTFLILQATAAVTIFATRFSHVAKPAVLSEQ
ncbi:MAG TPA: MFS transporter [Novosphingobium sp.]|nr:MFS transporter [Novosphingobium sp.]